MTPSDTGETAEGYIRYSRRKALFIAGCCMVLAGLVIATIRMGGTDLTYGEILRYIFRPDDSWESSVVWDLRLRVILAAVIAGAALGIAGAVMQILLRNPMASPFTLGTSNAAAFGASVAILFLNGGTVSASIASSTIVISQPGMVTLCAFAFAMLSVATMLLIVKFTGASSESIVLAGMAISSIFSALLAMTQYLADSTTLSSIVSWQFGSVSRIAWGQEMALLLMLIAVSWYFIWKRWDYNTMENGEDVAKGLGINVGRTRIVGLTLSALLTATVVAFMGVIGFIGLIAPHIARKFIGNDNRYILPGSLAIGGLVMLVAYIIASYAFSSSLPIGIITSAVGGPMFIAILLGRRRRV